DLVGRRSKRTPKLAAAPRPVTQVGIIGAGLMATQLATLFLRRLELPLVLADVDEQALERARSVIEAELAGLVSAGRCDEGKARFLGSLVQTTIGRDEFAGCQLVLEAVYEELEVKRQGFAELEAVVAPEAVLAANTSALSVTDMARGLANPERVVGMHFFNPVALLPLVEIVRGEATDDETVATALDLAARLRKRPVLVRDAPGFVVNRVLTRMLAALLGALERGNSVEEPDEAILRLGLPMAPSVLLQMVGPRVALHVLETLHAAYPERFPLSRTLANYAAGREEIAVSEQSPLTQDEILESALAAIDDEVRHLLDEGVVPDAADVDTALILGAGFPFWLGGITKHLDETGVSARMASCETTGAADSTSKKSTRRACSSGSGATSCRSPASLPRSWRAGVSPSPATTRRSSSMPVRGTRPRLRARLSRPSFAKRAPRQRSARSSTGSPTRTAGTTSRPRSSSPSRRSSSTGTRAGRYESKPDRRTRPKSSPVGSRTRGTACSAVTRTCWLEHRRRTRRKSSRSGSTARLRRAGSSSTRRCPRIPSQSSADW